MGASSGIKKPLQKAGKYESLLQDRIKEKLKERMSEETALRQQRLGIAAPPVENIGEISKQQLRNFKGISG
jgi:hypothetical protein